MDTDTIEFFVPDKELKGSDFSVFRKLGYTMEYARRHTLPKALFDIAVHPMTQHPVPVIALNWIHGIEKDDDGQFCCTSILFNDKEFDKWHCHGLGKTTADAIRNMMQKIMDRYWPEPNGTTVAQKQIDV